MTRAIVERPADAADQLPTAPPPARSHRGCFIAAALVLTLMVAECALQIVAATSPRVNALLGPSWARAAQADPSQAPVLPDEVLGVRGNPAYPGHDADGFRNRTAATSADIVTLGDSQTYGSMVAPNEAWPAVLAELSGASVRNLALGAWGPWEYSRTLERALSLRPRIVLVGLYLGNDLYDAYRAAYVARRARPWIDAARDAEFSAMSAFGSPDDAGPALFAARSSGPAHACGGTVRGWISTHVRLYGLTRAAKDMLSPAKPGDGAGLDTQDWAAVLEWAARRPQWCAPFEHDGLRTVFTARYRRQALDLHDPRVAEGFRLTVAALTDMNRRCDAVGIRLVVIVIPTKETVFAPLVPSQARSADYADLLTSEETTAAALHTALSAAGVESFDVLDALREPFAAHRQPYAISADGHPNAAGHRAIATRVAASFAAN